MKRMLASTSSIGERLGRWQFLIGILLILVAVFVFWMINRGALLTASSVMVGAQVTSADKANVPIIGSDQISAEDYAVYTAALADPSYRDGRSVVIRDRTFKYPELKEESALNDFVAKTPGVLDDTVKDFELKNKKGHRLENLFKLKVATTLVNSQEMDEMFDRDFIAAWQTVEEKYPNSVGIISLSRIGFDREKTQAIVYIGRGCGPICGESRFFLLVKEAGHWSVRSSVIISIS